MAATGRVLSFAVDESSHSAAYSLNVGNLRDTGHSDEATSPAAMADNLSVETLRSTVAFSANAASPDTATSHQLHCQEQSMKLAQAT